MKFLIKIDRGEEIELVSLEFNSRIEAEEYCQIQTAKGDGIYKLVIGEEGG